MILRINLLKFPNRNQIKETQLMTPRDINYLIIYCMLNVEESSSYVNLVQSAVTMSLMFGFGILVICSTAIEAINIDCVPLEKCPFANNLLTNRTTISRSLLTFINSTKCGIDEATNKYKVWCSRFANCRGPDQRFGTCIDVTTCGELDALLDETKTDQERLASINQYRCHLPNVTDVLVCCPWAQTKPKKKKRHAHWFPHRHDFDDDDLGEPHQIHHRFQGHFIPPDNVNNRFGGSEEKDECITPDNKMGTCKDIHECSHLVNILENADTSNRNEVEYVRGYQCPSSRGSFQICCPAQVKREVVASDDVDREFNSCGRQITSNRIVGGDLADVSEFPWTALIRYRKSTGELQFGCGGSIINSRYIVTAAHCVNRRILKKNGFEKIQNIVLGEYDTRNNTDCFGTECADEPQIVGVDKIIEHRLFKKKGNVQHDIALIRVDRDIQFNDYVKPICLPKQNAKGFDNQSFIIAGWGLSDDGTASPQKRKAVLTTTDKVQCNQKGQLGEGQICMDSRNGVDSCKGDSGGPVMFTTVRNGDLVTILVGIISYGFGTCGTTTSVSTYVPFYVDWIKENVF